MIYLDNGATTPLDGDVLEAMLPYLKENYGNAQSQHGAGRASANALISARDKVAELLGCRADEVYFVSSGTEAGNTALKGVCLNRGKGRIVISSIEHPALYESALDMQKLGFEVTFVDPDKNGVVSAKSVESALTDDTVFCAVMSANNETGVIQPVEEIAKVCRERGIFYYTDSVQTAGCCALPTATVDGLGISAHKFYGPKGVGALYIKNGSKFSRLISGGMQERGLRGGTSNVAGAVGLAYALEKAVKERQKNNAHVKTVRDGFLDRVLKEIPCAKLNGCKDLLLPGHANVTFDGCDGENILFMLDLKGVCVSTGSACSAGAVAPSRSLISMGLGEREAKSAVRFTFGKYNTREEADLVVEELKKAVNIIKRT
ncbi:MAG: cysteine desulfurase [Clostridia bacterium]|nr:cysteine desulfurase [Clostridia bacterium]